MLTLVKLNRNFIINPKNINTYRNLLAKKLFSDKDVKKELETTPEEIQKRKELEQKKRLLAESYTEEEFKKINSKNEDIIFMEIKEKNKSKLLLAKRISLFFNIPLSIGLMFGIDLGFGDTSELSPKMKILYYTAMMFDYLLFINAITILAGCRNIVLFARYIPKEQIVEFTKLNLFCKKYIMREAVSDLKRLSGKNRMTPFLSLKNMKTNNMYSMNSVGIWKDRKLYNSLFPVTIPVKNKKEGKNLLDM